MTKNNTPKIYKINLKITEVINRELGMFLLLATHTIHGRSYDTNRVFEIKANGDTMCFLKLGGDVEGNSDINLEFEYPLSIDLQIFDQKALPIVASGGLRAWTPEMVKLRNAQDEQRKKVEKEIRALIPFVAQILNRFNEACRLSLYEEAINWDFLMHDMEMSVRHISDVPKGDPLEKEHSDAAFLFSAFPSRGAARLAQEVNIEYHVEDEEGRLITGNLQGERSGQSPRMLAEKQDRIQELLHQPWSIADGVLLAAVEYLYADNYRMAVFNAVTVLELVMEEFYQRKVRKAGAAGQILEKDIDDYKRKHNVSKTEAKFMIFLPQFLDHQFVWSGKRDHCLKAWHFRDRTVAHLTTPKKDRKMQRGEAWDMVVSIVEVVKQLKSFM